MDQMDSTSKEQQEQALSLALGSLKRGIEKVGPMIDDLTSAGLKRVLKTITHFYFADNIVNDGKHKLEENEQKLIDAIFMLQEDVLGYTQLYSELNPREEESNEESELTDEGENNE